MKIAGKRIETPKDTTIVFPRQGRDDIILTLQAVLDYTAFEEFFPKPNPPEIILKGGERRLLYDSPKYDKAITDWSTKRFQWMILKSLEATTDLEWETVDIMDSETWDNYKTELKETFTLVEINKLTETVVDVCGLNASKIEEATESFLVSQQVAPILELSPKDEPKSTPSGEPASDLESDQQK